MSTPTNTHVYTGSSRHYNATVIAEIRRDCGLFLYAPCDKYTHNSIMNCPKLYLSLSTTGKLMELKCNYLYANKFSHWSIYQLDQGL